MPINNYKYLNMLRELTLLTKGASSTFLPNLIPNLQFWLDASSGPTTNGVTPATDGKQVQQWNDRSVSGNNAVNLGTTFVAPMYKANAINGKPAVRYSGGQNLTTSNSFLNSSYNSGATIFIVDSSISTALAMTLSIGFTQLYVSHYNGQIDFNTALSTSQAAYSVTTPVTGVFGWRYNGAVQNLLTNKLPLYPEVCSGNLNLSGPLSIGSALGGPGSYPFTGDIAEVIMYNSAITDNQFQQVNNYLINKYVIPTLTSLPAVQFIGDSMTAGVGSSGGLDYPTQTILALGGTGIYYDNIQAQNNETIADMLADAAYTTNVDANYLLDANQNKVRPYNILVLLGGTNDLAVDLDTPAVCQGLIQTYCQARKTAGYQVVVNTILPRNVTGNFEINRQAVNSWIRTGYLGFANALSDIGNDPLIGVSGACLNTLYYGDGTHPTNTGYFIMAAYAAAAVHSMGY